MSNIQPYKKQIKTDINLFAPLQKCYSLSTMDISNINDYPIYGYSYVTCTQNYLGANVQFDTAQIYKSIGKLVYPMVESLPNKGGSPSDSDKHTILRIPLFDENGLKKNYIRMCVWRINATTLVQESGTTTHYYNQYYLQYGLTGDDGINFLSGTPTITNMFNIGSWDFNGNIDVTLDGPYICPIIDTYGEDEDTILTFFFPNQIKNIWNLSQWRYGAPTGIMLFNFNNIYDFYNTKIQELEYSDSTGQPAEEELEYGGGSFDDSSDLIDLPTMPTIGVSTSGFSNIYKVSTGDLINFVNELFPPFNGITPPVISNPNDIVEGLTAIFECLENLIGNIFPLAEMWINKGLLDYVISCHVIPCVPTTGTSDNICVGWKTFTQTAEVVSTDYVDVDCGTISIEEYFGLFPDYLSTIQLYLPFVGFVSLQPEFLLSEKNANNGNINVTYRFNVVDGSFMVYVRSTSSKSELEDSIIAQYSGTCAIQLPITATDYSNIYKSILNGASNIGVSVASGNAVGVGQSVSDLCQMRPELAQSNVYSSTSSFLGYRYPYLLIGRPSYFVSRDYISESGVPLGVRKTIGSLNGFVKCVNPITDNLTGIDEDEKQEIKNMLKEGIYV